MAVIQRPPSPAAVGGVAEIQQGIVGGPVFLRSFEGEEVVGDQNFR